MTDDKRNELYQEAFKLLDEVNTILHRLRESHRRKVDAMDLDTTPGSKVVYVRQPGKVHDDVYRIPTKYELVEGQEYTVEEMDVSSSYSFVHLKEFPGVPFNTLAFKNV